MKRFTRVLLVAMLVLALTACFKPKEEVIYFSLFNARHPVVKMMRHGFWSACEDFDLKCAEILVQEPDIDAYVSAMEQVGASGAAGAVVYADNPALYAAAKALNAKMPTASAHTAYPPGESPTDAWFACDVSLAAEEVALKLGERMGGRGVAALSQSSSNVLEDKTGEVFVATMAEHYPDIEVLPSFYEGLEATEAIAKASAAFMERPDITGVFGMTGGSPTTWAVAMRDAGVAPGVVPIVGMDYTEPNLELVKSGEVYALVGQPLVEEFYAATKAVADMLAGKEVPEGNLLPAPFITLDTVHDYDAYVAAANGE